MAEILDTRKLIPGYKGKLYSDDGTFLAAVNTFTIALAIQTTKYRPAGSPVEVSTFESLSQQLTFTEALVNDAALLKKLFDGLRAGTVPVFGFAGVIEGMDGTELRVALYNCVPDGTIDVAQVQPGNTLMRQWSFAINDLIDPTQYLGS